MPAAHKDKKITTINKIWQQIYDEATNTIRTTAQVTINPGDISIGAVEIKDSTTNDRLTVFPDGTFKVRASGYDSVGGTYPYVSVDADGHIQADILTLPSINISSQNWPFINAEIDVIDRANRILGKTDIAAFDVSLPTGDNRIGKIKLVDTLDQPLDVVQGVLLPANTRGLVWAGIDQSNIVRYPNVTVDGSDGKNRLEIVGKVAVSPPTPPVASTPVTIDASVPLSLTGTDTTDYNITDGTIFTIQQITAGAEGDPTEKGAKIAIFYVDAGGIDHIIERIYLTGETVQTFPDTSFSRDGAPLLGTGVVGTGLIRVIREQFGGGARELDAVVRGFEI